MPDSNPPSDEQFMHASPPPRWGRRAARLVGILFSCLLLLAVCLGLILYESQLPHPVVSGIYLCSDCPGTPWPQSVSMGSADNGWAVGTAVGGASNRSKGVLIHYQNGQWMPLSLPASTPELSSVVMLSASDGWIVGESGIILHYTGGHWVSVESPTHDSLSSVFMLSPTDGWAVGEGGTILHYAGGVWTLVLSNPSFQGLRSIYMTAPNEGWAVGFHVIAHYSYGSWTTLNLSALLSPLVLFSVTMISASEGWAVGDNPSVGAAIILHDQNGQWQLDATAPHVQGLLNAVAMVSPNEGWALGTNEGASGAGGGSLIVHYTRAGGWAQVPTGLEVGFSALSMLSPTDGWAVGMPNTFVHYANGIWC